MQSAKGLRKTATAKMTLWLNKFRERFKLSILPRILSKRQRFSSVCFCSKLRQPKVSKIYQTQQSSKLQSSNKHLLVGLSGSWSSFFLNGRIPYIWILKRRSNLGIIGNPLTPYICFWSFCWLMQSFNWAFCDSVNSGAPGQITKRQMGRNCARYSWAFPKVNQAWGACRLEWSSSSALAL